MPERVLNMKYSVIGVDAESGANRAITVTGDSEDAAHTAAKAAGVFPTSITLKPEDAPILQNNSSRS